METAAERLMQVRRAETAAIRGHLHALVSIRRRIWLKDGVEVSLSPSSARLPCSAGVARQSQSPARAGLSMSFLLAIVVVALPATGKAQDPVQGPVDETLKEVVASLEASSVVKVPLARYAVSGLEALASFDRCLSFAVQHDTITLTCLASSMASTWPPTRASDVATLLANAARLVDPSHEIRPERVQRICRALAMAVDDPFTAYLSPKMMQMASSRKHGFAAATTGIELWPRSPARIRDVRLGSDAALKGIGADDTIVAIEGVDIESLTYIEVLQRMSGLNGSELRLRVRPGRGGPPRTIVVNRTLVPEDDLRRGVLGSVVYVGIPSFRSGIADDVRRTISAGLYAGIILDLRHNSGGLLSEGVALVDLFLRDGPIGGIRSGPGRPTEDFIAHRDAHDTTLPLVVLIDGQSASASEFTAMVLKDRGRALVLGATTAGKGSVQRQIGLPDGGLLKVTAGYYTGPSGRRLDEGGVRPHRFLAPSARRTALEGGEIIDDSWVLSALDAFEPMERSAVLRPAVGPIP
jgi:carboxyl-terminal processing protease